MLFGYPLAATQNNWLHDCVLEAVKNVHALVDGKKRYPAWPKILPGSFQRHHVAFRASSRHPSLTHRPA